MNMQRMQVKICGITRSDDLHLACAAGADFVGLIRAASQRQVTAAVAAQLVAQTPSDTHAVLLYLDEAVDAVIDELRASRASWVQLHGAEPPADIRRLRDALPHVAVIKALTILGSTTEIVARARQYAGIVDVLLLDGPKGGPLPPITAFDAVAEALREIGPAIWRAGGLAPATLTAQVKAGLYDGIDVASGVEARPGIKDADRVARVIRYARTVPPRGPCATD